MLDPPTASSQRAPSPTTIDQETNAHSGNYNVHSRAGREASPAKRQKRISDAPATYHCQICPRFYERADRLTRHMKTHENARQHSCQHCQKSFNRADLLTRHMNTHSRDTSAPGQIGVSRAERAIQACCACAAAKVRCEDHKPCRRCKTKNIRCEVAEPKSGDLTAPGPFSTSSRSSKRDKMDGQRISVSDQDHQYTAPFSVAAPYEQQPSALDNNPQPLNNPRSDQYANHHEPTVAQSRLDPTPAPLVSWGQLNFDNVINQVLFPSNTLDFNNQILDVNFQDFAFSDEQFDIIPEDHRHKTVTVEASGNSSRSNRDVRAGYAAFTRSPWLWTPERRDRVLGYEENLTLDESSISSALTPRSPNMMPNIPSCGFPKVLPAMRDKMYYLVSTMNKFTDKIPGFPPLGVLDHVVEAFFIRQSYQVDNWIHVPSISRSEAEPEFMTALVSAGSTVISVPGIWKMGLVLQDVLSVKLPEMWHRQNSATRQLQPLQAWMLQLDAGLWSGFKRQMEMAESLGQPIVTMMRRGGMLGMPMDFETFSPYESDIGTVLEAKWNRWTQLESFKRLAIHLFLHDTRASIALQKHPLLSVTEITYSLPASRDLYLAGSAAEWKLCFQEQRRSSLTTPKVLLVDVMHDPSILDNLRTEVDVNLSYTTALHGFWSQIWGFRESWKFHAISENRDSVHRIWLITQQRELYHQINTFKQTLQGMQTLRYELLVVAELLLMILYISPEELQRFAGRYGEDAAAQAFTSLEGWIVTEDARRAVWHAGQVFRWALLMPLAELRDFYAIAVYFAGITVWAFGHLSSARDTSNDILKNSFRTSGVKPDEQPSCLVINGEDSSATKSFFSGRKIIPVLKPIMSRLQSDGLESWDRTFVEVDDSNAVFQVARDLYRINFPIENELLPPLVENMGKLMRDLGSLPDSRFPRGVSPMEGVQ